MKNPRRTLDRRTLEGRENSRRKEENPGRKKGGKKPGRKKGRKKEPWKEGRKEGRTLEGGRSGFVEPFLPSLLIRNLGHTQGLEGPMSRRRCHHKCHHKTYRRRVTWRWNKS
jgi:hypothetical protein